MPLLGLGLLAAVAIPLLRLPLLRGSQAAS
jgi:hypothetical protein